jgi:hypothetical protein
MSKKNPEKFFPEIFILYYVLLLTFSILL